MDCSRCHSTVPDVAHFCHRCGLDLLPEGERGKRRFAVKPDEPVASFALVPAGTVAARRDEITRMRRDFLDQLG